MGLDQYAYSVNRKFRKNSVELRIDLLEQERLQGHHTLDDVFYWRKNRHIHNWMHDLYTKKCAKLNKEVGEFNTNDIVFLSTKDLQALRRRILNHDIDSYDTEGFFWGHGNYDDNDREKDLEFVDKALEILKDPDKCIFYTSWW